MVRRGSKISSSKKKRKNEKKKPSVENMPVVPSTKNPAMQGMTEGKAIEKSLSMFF